MKGVRSLADNDSVGGSIVERLSVIWIDEDDDSAGYKASYLLQGSAEDKRGNKIGFRDVFPSRISCNDDFPFAGSCSSND